MAWKYLEAIGTVRVISLALPPLPDRSPDRCSRSGRLVMVCNDSVAFAMADSVPMTLTISDASTSSARSFSIAPIELYCLEPGKWILLGFSGAPDFHAYQDNTEHAESHFKRCGLT